MAGLSPSTVLAVCVENNGPMLLATGWALLALAIIFIFLRVLFRHRYGNGLHGDDYTMLASLGMGITAVILLTFFVNVGFGQHIYCLPASAMPFIFKYSVLAQIFNIAGIGLVKISVCLHILRIIHRARRDISIFLHLLILITSLSHLAQILLFCVQCRPMPAIWDPQKYPHAKCFSSHITYLAAYIGFGLDAFTDLVTAVIPIVVIRALQMNTRTKAALCVLMGLGVLTAICAIAKAITLQGVFAADYTWALWRPGLCTIIEHLMGMIIASAPALNPLFKRALRTPTSASRSSNSRQSGRQEQAEKDRQSRRVTRWADAWTPPNVHVAHYSPYNNEQEKSKDQSDETTHHHLRHHSTSSTSGNKPAKSPTTASTTTLTTSTNISAPPSNNTTPDSYLTTIGSDHRNEITKTVSFHRVSKGENDFVVRGGGGASQKESTRVDHDIASGDDIDNHDVNDNDVSSNNNNMNNDDNSTIGHQHPATLTTTTSTHAFNSRLMPNQLLIRNGNGNGNGNGSCADDLPSTAASILARSTPRRPGVGVEIHDCV